MPARTNTVTIYTHEATALKAHLMNVDYFLQQHPPSGEPITIPAYEYQQLYSIAKIIEEAIP